MRPTKNEEAYIAQLQAERQQELRRQREKEEATRRREQERELHFMHCPKCGAQLAEVQNGNLAVDRCTECGGVWLDPGELEQVQRASEPVLRRFIAALTH